MMESSRAANCPTVTYQLVGTKKIQQVLAAKAILQKYIVYYYFYVPESSCGNFRFISDISVVEKIQSTFAGLYSLDLVYTNMTLYYY